MGKGKKMPKKRCENALWGHSHSFRGGLSFGFPLKIPRGDLFWGSDFFRIFAENKQGDLLGGGHTIWCVCGGYLPLLNCNWRTTKTFLSWETLFIFFAQFKFGWCCGDLLGFVRICCWRRLDMGVWTAYVALSVSLCFLFEINCNFGPTWPVPPFFFKKKSLLQISTQENKHIG